MTGFEAINPIAEASISSDSRTRVQAVGLRQLERAGRNVYPNSIQLSQCFLGLIQQSIDPSIQSGSQGTKDRSQTFSDSMMLLGNEQDFKWLFRREFDSPRLPIPSDNLPEGQEWQVPSTRDGAQVRV